jgi:hypothetical protein
MSTYGEFEGTGEVVVAYFKAEFRYAPLRLVPIFQCKIRKSEGIISILNSKYENNPNIFTCVKHEVTFSFSLVKSRWRSWLRHCPISRKVAGAIPDSALGIFY